MILMMMYTYSVNVDRVNCIDECDAVNADDADDADHDNAADADEHLQPQCGRGELY